MHTELQSAANRMAFEEGTRTEACRDTIIPGSFSNQHPSGPLTLAGASSGFTAALSGAADGAELAAGSASAFALVPSRFAAAASATSSSLTAPSSAATTTSTFFACACHVPTCSLSEQATPADHCLHIATVQDPAVQQTTPEKRSASVKPQHNSWANTHEVSIAHKSHARDKDAGLLTSVMTVSPSSLTGAASASDAAAAAGAASVSIASPPFASSVPGAPSPHPYGVLSGHISNSALGAIICARFSGGLRLSLSCCLSFLLGSALLRLLRPCLLRRTERVNSSPDTPCEPLKVP